jgi:RNA polymerase-binding transcription factor DksA
MNAYPLDYQLVLERTMRIRMEKLRGDGCTEDVQAMEDALGRLLHDRDYGMCRHCRGLIPFTRLTADPAARLCDQCGDQYGDPCTTTT